MTPPRTPRTIPRDSTTSRASLSRTAHARAVSGIGHRRSSPPARTTAPAARRGRRSRLEARGSQGAIQRSRPACGIRSAATRDGPRPDRGRRGRGGRARSPPRPRRRPEPAPSPVTVSPGPPELRRRVRPGAGSRDRHPARRSSPPAPLAAQPTISGRGPGVDGLPPHGDAACGADGTGRRMARPPVPRRRRRPGRHRRRARRPGWHDTCSNLHGRPDEPDVRHAKTASCRVVGWEEPARRRAAGDSR